RGTYCWILGLADKNVRATRLSTGSDGLFFGRAGQDAEDFFFTHDDEVFAVQLNLGAAVLTEQNAVAFLHIEWADFSVLTDLAFSNRNHFSLLRLLFRTIRNDDSAAGGFAFFHAPNQDAVVQWGEFRSHFR